MSGVTRVDRTGDEYETGSVGLTSIVDETRQNGLGWFGHVTRRENSEAVSVAMDVEGRPKKKVVGCDWA